MDIQLVFVKKKQKLKNINHNSVHRPAVFDRRQHFLLYLALLMYFHQRTVGVAGFEPH
jgi:hypothetical protein